MDKCKKTLQDCSIRWDSAKALRKVWTDGRRKIKDEVCWGFFFANYGSWFLMAPFDPSFPPQWDYFDGWLAVFDLEAKIGGAISAFCIATVRDGEGFLFWLRTRTYF